MPQCQFPVFCYFWFRKSCSGNILGIGRHEDRSPYLGTMLPMLRPCRATTRCGPPGSPPTSPFRLYIAPDAKTLKELASIHEKFRSSATIEDKFRGIEISVPAPCRDRELPPEPSPSTPPPSSSPLLTPMMRREEFSPEAEGSTCSYVVYLSLSHGVIFM